MNTTINTPNTVEAALINLVNEAIENGRANIGNIEARVYSGRVRLFVDGVRANRGQVLELLNEMEEREAANGRFIARTDQPLRHAQNLFDNETARAVFQQDVQQALNEAPNGLTAWSLHKVLTTVFGWAGFAQRSPELSANLFNRLSQESGLVRYVPTQRGARTVYVAQLV